MKVLFVFGIVLALFLGCATAHATPPAPPDLGPGVIQIGTISIDDLDPVQTKLNQLAQAGAKSVTLVFDSQGGSVFEGLSFIKNVEQLKRKNGLKLVCVGDISVMSMALVVFEDLCDTRLATRRALFLAHNTSESIQGNALKLDSEAQFSHVLDGALAEVVAAKTKLTPQEYQARIAKGDWTFGADEALSTGFIDGFASVADLPPAYVLDEPAASIDLKKLLGL